MRLLVVILLTINFQLKAQIMIDPYVQGQFRNDVVYVGSYESPGTCSFNDGTDFNFDFSGLFLPDGLEFVLIIDAPDPTSTFLLNGWAPVNVGDSTVFTPSTQGIGMTAASGPATTNFHIRVIGTPTSSGQENPCWITEAVTEALCGNTYTLLPGESLVPCVVTASVGILDPTKNQVEFTLSSNGISINCDEEGALSLFDMSGRVVITKPVNPGFTFLEIQSIKNGNYIVRFEGSNGTHSQKIALQ
jgi:hypothetical protein